MQHGRVPGSASMQLLAWSASVGRNVVHLALSRAVQERVLAAAGMHIPQADFWCQVHVSQAGAGSGHRQPAAI